MNVTSINTAKAAKVVPVGVRIADAEWPDKSEKGNALNTIANTEYMLARYNIKCRYNEMRHDVEIKIPGRSYGADNEGNCSLTEVMSLAALNGLPRSETANYIAVIADKNAFHPVRDWIESKPWDGESRLEQLYNTLSTSGNPELKQVLMRRWLISAVAALYHPRDYSAHGVLVLVGGQGVGKTSFVKSLVPEELRAVLEGATLDPADKDMVMTVCSHWIVELGELDGTFKKADIARLKAFITKSVDKLRRPYERKDAEFRRRTVFFGSVNEDQFLVDQTGNRRWWTVPISGANFSHKIDVQQLWAEVLDLYRAGEQWWLTDDETAILTGQNANHEAADPLEEMIVARFNWGVTGGKLMTATNVLQLVGVANPTRQHTSAVARILKKLTGGDPERKKDGRYYNMPPAKFMDYEERY